MIRQIAPQFFTTEIPVTLAYYKDKLGFECLGTWQDPPVYAIVARDQHSIHFRCAQPPTANSDKYADELLDAYLFIEDADALYDEYAARATSQFPTGTVGMSYSQTLTATGTTPLSWSVVSGS